MANENEIRPGVDKRGSGDMSKYDRPPFVQQDEKPADQLEGGKPKSKRENEGRVG